jgi:hypothetical protein
VDPQPRGPDWMQITPKAGSLFHAYSQPRAGVKYLPNHEGCVGYKPATPASRFSTSSGTSPLRRRISQCTPVTNVRNLKLPYWRGWLKAEWLCLVPATSFREWTDSRPKLTRWFALDDALPLCQEGLASPKRTVRAAFASRARDRFAGGMTLKTGRTDLPPVPEPWRRSAVLRALPRGRGYTRS